MEFQGLLSETEMLLWDLRSLETQLAALYHLERAPDNTRALRDRLLAIRRARQERLTQAQRLQTLQRTALRIADRIMSLADRILDILGDRQGLQNLQGQLATISHTETQTGTLIAAYQQVMLDDPQEQLLIDESMDRINTTLLATLPGRRP
jgi:hypothetical protein